MLPQGPLIGPGDIIVGSWRNFRGNVRVYAEFAVWFVALRVTQWAFTTVTARTIDDRYLRLMMDGVFALPVYFVVIVLTVSLIDLIARHLRDRKADERSSLSAGFHKVFPAIWVSFLASLIVGLGFLAFVLPGIYLAVRYHFAQNAVIVDDLHGGAALGESKKLVAGRWWAIFARIVLPGVFYYVAATFVIYVAYLLAGSAFGDPGIFFGQISTLQNLPATHSLVAAIIRSAIDGLSLPLFLGCNLILWFDLKRMA